MDENIQKSSKGLIYTFLAFVLIFAFGIGIYLYNLSLQKSPFERINKIYDTNTHIETSYNSKYNIARLDITIDETVEDWQIKALGGNQIELNLECETKDKTVKKDYYFYDVILTKGEKIKASLI